MALILGEFCLFSRAKSMISSLSAGLIMLWTSGSLSPIQTPKGYSPPDLDQHLQLGLKTLIYTQPYHQNPAINSYHHHPPEIVQSYMVLNSSSSSPSSPPTPSSLSPPPQILDDLIGTDNGVYMITNSNYEQANNGIHDKWKSQRQLGGKEERHYPPPIPLLAQTGNLVGRMPWILTRHYTDGRLILRREKVQHHEYFQAQRENGRLILNLVTMECDDDEEEEEDQESDQDHEEYYFEEVEGENYSSLPLQFSEEVEDHDDQLIIESENEDHEDDHDHELNGDDDDDDTSTTDHVMVLESVISYELSYLENAISTTTYACGMLMNFHERSHLYSSQPPSSPLRPMASVIM